MVGGWKDEFGRRVGCAGCFDPVGSNERGVLFVTGEVGESGDVGESDTKVPVREDLRRKIFLIDLLRNILSS